MGNEPPNIAVLLIAHGSRYAPANADLFAMEMRSLIEKWWSIQVPLRSSPSTNPSTLFSSSSIGPLSNIGSSRYPLERVITWARRGEKQHSENCMKKREYALRVSSLLESSLTLLDLALNARRSSSRRTSLVGSANQKVSKKGMLGFRFFPSLKRSK